MSPEIKEMFMEMTPAYQIGYRRGFEDAIKEMKLSIMKMEKLQSQTEFTATASTSQE